MELDNKISEVIKTYSVKPALNQLHDGPWFITDDKHREYKNEKHNARAEGLDKYYTERGIDKDYGFTDIQVANQKSLMKTVTLGMIEELADKDKDINFFSEQDMYILENERTNETVYSDEKLNVLQVIKSPTCNCNPNHKGCGYPKPIYKNLFDAVCSQIQEDVCVMQHDSLAAVHVCLPSHWKPADRIGQNFATIHGEVPGMGKMKHDKIWSACVNKGPYERFNWTLTDSPILNQHPDKNIGKDFDSDELYLRIERQVLKGFPKVQGLLFMIRTFVINIEELDKEQKISIINSIEGMNADELIYKGLSEKTKYNNVISLLDR